MRISSPSNERIKSVMQLQTKASVRKKQKMFVIEGQKMYEETPDNQLEMTYVSEKFYDEYIKVGKISDKVKSKLNKKEYIIVADPVFKNMSDTVTPQGIMAVVRQNEYELSDILKKDKRQIFLVLESLQDPGNMGTIIRTAEGAGIDGIIVNKETVDMYNPKVIRSTMGSIYRVPVVICQDLSEAVDELSRAGVTLYAAHLKGDVYYTDGQFDGSVGLMIGNEANGLSDEMSKKAHKLIKIPMDGQVESLNAAVAAAILMYEVKRQCSPRTNSKVDK